MAATDRSRSEAAKQRRQDQLRRWQGSETDLTGAEMPSRALKSAKVRFAQGAVFMAACSAGDREEVAELLRQGADINHANVDGLTALHQACIDENAEMVQFLVESGSGVNRSDNEGWTPLHVAASCGFTQIAKARCAGRSSKQRGELPLDVATEDAMEKLLKTEIKKQGVDVEQARREEERVMMQDAMAVLAGSGPLVSHPNTKATPLHVAAAKGYIEVLKVLLKCKVDVNSKDCDGWTALHAAAHWGQEEACSLLVDHMCDMNAVNNVGQTPLDVSDENLVEKLEELQKKQNAMRTEKQKIKMPVIETSPPISMAPVRPRRTSISRMSSKEKITLHPEPTRPAVSEAPGSWRTSLRKAGSSVTLGSSGTSDAPTENPRATENTSSIGMSRSASSPKLTSDTDTKEPRLARVQPTPSRRLFSIGDSSTSSTADNPSRKLDDPTVASVTTQGTSGLSRLNNIVAQRLAQEESEKKEPVSTTTTTTAEEAKQRRRSYLTPVRDEEAEAQRKARSRHARQSRRSTQGVTLTDLQEAEKTIKTDNKAKDRTKEEEDKEVKQKKAEEGEVSWRSRIANLQKSDLLGLTHPPGAPRPADKRVDVEDSLAEIEERARERRRARARRRERIEGSEDNTLGAEDERSGGPDPQEKGMLERRATELEEELKVLGDLKADNQRLKDENGALIRVISKLSK
ncbi:Protein phosphatase 1 regulatory subunit 12C [Bagarius yarrelli]|uniref:Protein phosphatase 1 regulatory subunit 12B n=1 Tax=Bagarius yarrelli TaxID=175774 RepID=A0A556TI17_BAGYA|nr:Protein phosphatase 1 regulatory subunit 12C [Bagarius yarrelli]